MTIMCGRPTKRGTPCRKITRYADAPWIELVGTPPCEIHGTPNELNIFKALLVAEEHGRSAGFRSGHESGEMAERLRREYQEREAEREALRQARMRFATASGDQIVEVGRYAYAWRGSEPLAVGDRVQLPPSWVNRDGWTGEVSGLGSDYDGRLEHIVRKLDAEQPAHV